SACRYDVPFMKQGCFGPTRYSATKLGSAPTRIVCRKITNCRETTIAFCKSQSRRSTNVLSVTRCLQFEHRDNSLKMNSYGPRLPVTSASNQSKGISELWG